MGHPATRGVPGAGRSPRYARARGMGPPYIGHEKRSGATRGGPPWRMPAPVHPPVHPNPRRAVRLDPAATAPVGYSRDRRNGGITAMLPHRHDKAGLQGWRDRTPGRGRSGEARRRGRHAVNNARGRPSASRSRSPARLDEASGYRSMRKTRTCRGASVAVSAPTSLVRPSPSLAVNSRMAADSVAAGSAKRTDASVVP